MTKETTRKDFSSLGKRVLTALSVDLPLEISTEDGAASVIRPRSCASYRLGRRGSLTHVV
jgi:hypothetical protein